MSRVIKLTFRLGLGLLLLLQAGGAESRQATAPPPAAGAPRAPLPGAAPPSEVDISVRQRSTLGPQDMLNQSRDYRDRMEKILAEVQAQSDAARKRKDVIRLNCLLDKLLQLKANVTIAVTADRGLQEAISRRDDGASVHEYTRITIVHQKAQILGSDARACVGEDLAYVGATRVDVEVEGIGPEDPTQPWPTRPTFERPPVVARPPAASPFL
jgi:hypothetical protein